MWKRKKEKENNKAESKATTKIEMEVELEKKKKKNKASWDLRSANLKVQIEHIHTYRMTRTRDDTNQENGQKDDANEKLPNYSVISTKHIVLNSTSPSITSTKHHHWKYRWRIFFLTRRTWANSLDGSKCYNGKLLAKHQCHPWNMKWLFRTCTNFESLLILPPRSTRMVVCADASWVCVLLVCDGQKICGFFFVWFSIPQMDFCRIFFSLDGCPFYDRLCFG